MNISIIIAHNAEREDGLLDRLFKSIYRELDSSGIKGEILVETRGSKSESRNLAAENAQGGILVFLDDDVELRRHFLEEILEPFSDPRVGVVGGVNVAFPDLDYWEQISATLMSSPFLWFRSSARYTPRGGIRESDEAEVISCCMAIRARAFREAGGFPLDVIPCEENELVNRIQRLKWKVIYSPYAIVFHDRASFPGGYARKMFQYGTGRGIMMRKYKHDPPRMMWKPSFKWLFYGVGVLVHFGFYLAGVVNGYLRAGKEKKKE